MTSEFKPYRAREEVSCVIYKDEAVLLTKLRKYAYGKFVVHKADAIVIRVETNESLLIENDGEVNLD